MSCEAKTKSNPKINIRVDDSDENEGKAKGRAYTDEGTFEDVGQEPKAIGSVYVDREDFGRANIHFSVNWMAMPWPPTVQEADGPLATIGVMYDDGSGPRAVQFVEAATQTVSMPAVTSYSVNALDVGAGTYALMASINQGTMNSVAAPGQYSLEVEALEE